MLLFPLQIASSCDLISDIRTIYRAALKMSFKINALQFKISILNYFGWTLCIKLSLVKCLIQWWESYWYDGPQGVICLVTAQLWGLESLVLSIYCCDLVFLRCQTQRQASVCIYIWVYYLYPKGGKGSYCLEQEMGSMIIWLVCIKTTKGDNTLVFYHFTLFYKGLYVYGTWDVNN